MTEQNHNCVERINQQLAKHNTRISMAYSLDNARRELIAVSTSKIESSVRGRPVNLFATFCPFCGEKLQ